MESNAAEATASTTAKASSRILKHDNDDDGEDGAGSRLAHLLAMREEDGYEPTGYTLYSYGAVQAWVQAVQKAGSLKQDAVIEALKSGSFDKPFFNT